MTKLPSELQDLITKGTGRIELLPGMIVGTLQDLADRFLDFIGVLIEKMFNFLTQFGLIANKAGFNLSKIKIKLPKITLNQVNIFSFVNIAIPTLDAPDITITISSKAV